MDKALLDTDTLSEIGKGKNATVIANARQYRRAFGHYSFSTVSVLEIVRGYQRAQLTQRLNAFLSSIAGEEVFPIDLAAAELAGRITGDLERHGQPIGRADPMIAAVAIEQKLTLVTGNLAHFQRIVALGYPLALADWRQ